MPNLRESTNDLRFTAGVSQRWLISPHYATTLEIVKLLRESGDSAISIELPIGCRSPSPPHTAGRRSSQQQLFHLNMKHIKYLHNINYYTIDVTNSYFMKNDCLVTKKWMLYQDGSVSWKLSSRWLPRNSNSVSAHPGLTGPGCDPG